MSKSLEMALTEDLNRRIESCILDALKRSEVRKRTISLVVSAGQGAKIFTVAELLDRLFAGIPRETGYQENAVALGLGRYTGVLSGCLKDYLLLDALPTAIGIMCSKELDTKEDKSPIDFLISHDATKNDQLLILIPRDTTIPTRRSLCGQVMDSGDPKIELVLVEVDLNGTAIPLGRVQFDLGDKPFEITCDSDAARTLVVEVICEGQGVQAVQLNNFLSVSTFRKGTVRLLSPPSADITSSNLTPG